MNRSRWKGRLAISAASSGSARMKPWTGSRIESTRAAAGASVQLIVGGEMAEGPQPVDHQLPAAQDRQHRQPAVGQRLLQQRLLAQRRHVEIGGDAVDQLLEGATLGELVEGVVGEGKALAELRRQAAQQPPDG